jgi:hypothetical protein
MEVRHAFPGAGAPMRDASTVTLRPSASLSRYLPSKGVRPQRHWVQDATPVDPLRAHGFKRMCIATLPSCASLACRPLGTAFTRSCRSRIRNQIMRGALPVGAWFLQRMM